MNKRRLLTFLLIIILWEAAACLLRRPVIVPYPLDVIKIMGNDLLDSSFYLSVLHTLVRMLKGLAAALILALLSGVLSGLYPAVEEGFSAVNDIIKAIPNVSYIVIILIWLGGEKSVTVITFFILFPILYADILVGMHSVPENILKISMLEKIPLFKKIKAVYWPYVLPQLISSLKVSFGMGFKVSVMAEILGAVRIGVGREMSVARTYVETDRIVAWTIWIIILSLLVNTVFDMILRQMKKD